MDRAAARRQRRAAALDPRAPARVPRPPCLGLDVGGVLVDLVAEDSDTSFFGSRPLDTPAVAGSFDEVAALAHGCFAGRVVLVTKAGPRVAARTREWLAHRGFHAQTGIPASAVHVVRDRTDKDGVCTRLGVTHFVDDRVDVLTSLQTVSHRVLFLGGLGRREPATRVPPGLLTARSWPECAALLRASVPAP